MEEGGTSATGTKGAWRGVTDARRGVLIPKSGLVLRLRSPTLAAAPDLVDTISQEPPGLLLNNHKREDFNASVGASNKPFGGKSRGKNENWSGA